MTRSLVTSRALVLAVAVTMLTITVPAAAWHNSAGWEITVSQPDEVDSDGTLVPDIPESSPHLQEFHEDSPMGEEIQPRPQPEDQRGERYAPGDRHAGDTDCTTAKDFTGTDQEFREQVATNDDLCYVGFIDAQRETILFLTFLLNPQPNDFLLYQVNPAPGDEYCTGQENPDQHAGPSVDDGGPVDSAVASANRSALDDECDGSGHAWGVPGKINIDTDLVEAPLDGRALPTDGVAQATGTDPGSGARTLPMMTTPYVFLFGQPHPTEVAKDAGLADPSPDDVSEDRIREQRLIAGEGVFSGSAMQGSTTISNLDGACGDRTVDCALLTPDDVKAFDPYPDTGQGDEEQARFCEFAPQFVTVNPDGRAAGLCGVFGDVVNTFKGQQTAGGLGTGTGAPTWVNTLPGWYRGVITISIPTTFSTPLSVLGDYQDEEKEMFPGYLYYYAVNPKTPAGDDPTWCIRPNMESTGIGVDGKVAPDEDPGFFGPYRADAIDADVYPTAYRATLEDVRDDTHDPVYNAYNDSLNTLANAQDVVLSAVSDVSNQTPEEVNSTVDRVLTAYTQNISRANPFAQGWSADKDYNQLGNTQHDFTQVDEETGLACNGQGVPELQEKTSIDGGLIFDSEVDQQTVAIKDPTVLGDIEGVPAPQNNSESERGVWQTDAYSFDGNILGVADTNQDGDFDSCATPNGQNDPSEDFCPWQALWDAYNPSCTTFAGLSCLAQLDRAGYAVNDTHLYDTVNEEYLFPETDQAAEENATSDPDLELIDESEHGVGLYFSLEITGPFVLVDNEQDIQQFQDRTTVVGDEAVTARHCVVGTSNGFNKHLPSIVESELGLPEGTLSEAAAPMQATAERLCDTGPDGEVVVVTDAFNDQSGTNRGGFSSAVSFVKLAPTPDAVVDESGLGEGDELCLGGVWSVKDNRASPTDDTVGSLNFESGGGDYPHHYGECLDFGTGDDAQNTPGAPTSQ